VLGWAPEVGLDDGLRRTIDWFEAASARTAATRR
jgi:nucleoside-diphosphate-sugar epimerase